MKPSTSGKCFHCRIWSATVTRDWQEMNLLFSPVVIFFPSSLKTTKKKRSVLFNRFSQWCLKAYVKISILPFTFFLYVIAIFLMENNFLWENLPPAITVIHKDVNPGMICHNHGVLSLPGCLFSGLNLASAEYLRPVSAKQVLVFEACEQSDWLQKEFTEDAYGSELKHWCKCLAGSGGEWQAFGNASNRAFFFCITACQGHPLVSSLKQSKKWSKPCWRMFENYRCMLQILGRKGTMVWRR